MSDTVLIEGAKVTVLPAGTQAMVVHPAEACVGRTCVIHSPTEHSMSGFRLHWRADRNIFERLCPHGIGHPDPDQCAFWREQARDGVGDSWHGWLIEPGQDPDEYVAAQMIHGCDGCCR